MLQNMTISLATNGSLDEPAYRAIRDNLRTTPELWELAPRFIRTCRDQGQLWSHLRSVASGGGSWQARRDHVYENFFPLFERLEGTSGAPLDASASEILSTFDVEGVHRAWERAMRRRQEDPEGAITSARTLLETVCKHILEKGGGSYGKSDDLPKLYKQASELLNLAPSQHTEEAIRSILGGCHAVVQGLASLRNRLGDAHGQGRKAVRPAPRHAALAVNLAGAAATFLIETWQTTAKEAGPGT